jgi:putative cell wall-binding protein
MRKFQVAAMAAAVLAATVATASPAGAAGEGFKLSAASGPAGTKITVTSDDPCPAPPAGKTYLNAGVVLNDPGGYAVQAVDAVSAADRSWTATLTVPTTGRNGGYSVVAGCVATDGTPYAFYDGHLFTVTSPAGKADPAVRFAGTDRITTAIAASQDMIDVGFKVDALVLTRSDSFADALAGTPLATLTGGPLLLTGGASLDSRTEAEIKRVLTPNGTVYVLGGTAAVSDAAVQGLKLSGYTVMRLAGANRYATAVAIANEIDGPTTLLLATGTDFKAGLVAGAAAWSADEGDGGGAVLLTNGSAMPAETKAYIDAHGSAKRYAIGTPAAAADPGATPIVGTDDADLSQKVAAQFFPVVPEVAVASSANFPDALSGGAHAAFYQAPLLLTAPNALPASVQGYLAGHKSAIVIAYVYGGTAAVSENVRGAVVAAIS